MVLFIMGLAALSQLLFDEPTTTPYTVNAVRPNRPTEWHGLRRTSYGPQTDIEKAKARKALQGSDSGSDVIESRTLAGHSDFALRWYGYPGRGEIPYEIDDSLDNLKPLIRLAMSQYEENTCIKFIPRTFQRDYVRLYKGEGCWSMLGRIGGRQYLSLGDGCEYEGLIVHELGHAVGLFHEHQRSDRDDFIGVFEQNVLPGLQRNFDKTNERDEILHTEYNYNSIMHYGNYAFSRSTDHLRTMVALDGTPLLEPYEKHGLDRTDVWMVNDLYLCRSFDSTRRRLS